MVRFVSRQPCHGKFPAESGRRGEDGRASLEFLVAAVILLIPVLMLVVSLWELQRAQFATEAAARHAVRVYSLHTSSAQAANASQRALAHALEQWGVQGSYRAALRCSSDCLDPGSWVEISVVVSVPIGPFPPVPMGNQFTVPVRSSASALISAYRGDP